MALPGRYTTVSSSNDWYSILFANGQFVRGSSSSIQTSPNALTWNFATVDGSISNIQGFAYGDNRFVAAASGGFAVSQILTCPPAGTAVSAQGGDWTASATWACGIIPSVSSEVEIKASHVLTISSVVQAKNVNVLGEVSYTSGGALQLGY